MGIFFDNAATTKVRPEAFEIMQKYLLEEYGNPSAIYNLAKESGKALNKAREEVATALNAQPDEIFFTSGGTEADNWAIKGAAEAFKEKGKHIITSAVEHHAVLHTCEYLEKQGYEVTYLPVDSTGRVSVKDVEDAIREDTILITIMYANNEVGTIMPIDEIGQLADKHDIAFHTDAVQAFGREKIDVEKQHIDMLSLSAHKMYGPKGVGALYVRKGTRIHQFMHGGAQEKNRRAGTENVPGIAALGVCTKLAMEEMEEESVRVKALRDKLENGLLDNIPYTFLNGNKEHRLDSHTNIGFEFIEGEGILLGLNAKGIAASSGSACTSASLDASHVLLAMGIPHERAHGTLRLSLGRNNTEEEVDKMIEELPAIIERLRSMSPLYDREVKQKA